MQSSTRLMATARTVVRRATGCKVRYIKRRNIRDQDGVVGGGRTSVSYFVMGERLAVFTFATKVSNQFGHVFYNFHAW
jgi:hypothetical protein